MIKVHCYEWVGGIKNLPSWWAENSEVEITLEQLLELYQTGNNIMLYHGIDGVNVLCVDNKRFYQR